MSCSVPGCKSNASRKQNEDMFISYHRFPEHINYRTKWLEAIKKQDWIPKNKRICSKHFTLECFVNKDDLKWRRLKPEAVPTLLLPQSLQSSELDIQSDEIPCTSASQAQTSKCTDIPLQDITYGSENIPMEVDITTYKHTYGTLATLSVHNMELERVKAELARTKKRLSIVTEVAERRLRKINALKQKNRRMCHKHTEFSTMLEILLKNDDIDAEQLLILESLKSNEVIRRIALKNQGPLPREYTLELKKFAVTSFPVAKSV